MNLFKKIIFIPLCLFFIAVQAQPPVVPGIREWKLQEGTFQLNTSFPVITPKSQSSELRNTIELFVEDLKKISSLSPIQKTNDLATKGSIFFKLDKSSTSAPEGYVIEITDKIEVRASTIKGIFYGTQTLLQLIKQQQGLFEKGVINDAPDFGNRSVMIDAGRRFYQVSYIEELIRQMAWYKMNELHIHFTEWSAFRLKSDRYPGLAAADAYSREDIKKILATAKKYHITIVPEIDLPAHATVISEYNPSLGFQCESMRKARWQGDEANESGKAWTLDITRPEVRKWIHDLLEEFIPLFDSPYFHVGGDEYQYDPDKYKCPELIAYMEKKGYSKPGDVFIEWVNEVNEQVKKHGKQTQIWSWWNFGKNSTSIQPSKDIIVNVWNKSTEKLLLDDGYKVIVTPEEQLYVTPGLVDTSGYGLVDCREVYEQWEPLIHPNILGYKVCVWADKAEMHTDQWFEGHAFEPKVVVAEKIWAGAQKKDLESFLWLVNRIGDAPPILKLR